VQQDKQAVEQRASDIDIRKFFVVGRNPPNNRFVDFIWGGNIF